MKEAVIQDTMGNNTPNNNGLEQTEEEYTAAFISKKKERLLFFYFPILIALISKLTLMHLPSFFSFLIFLILYRIPTK